MTTLADLYAELDTFATLPPNWNSYGAEPIAPATIAAAKTFLARLYPLLSPDSNIGLSPTGEGGIVIVWTYRRSGHTNAHNVEMLIVPTEERSCSG